MQTTFHPIDERGLRAKSREPAGRRNAEQGRIDSQRAELAALFADHQEALLERRFADALVLLRRFRSSFDWFARDREPNVHGLAQDAFRSEYRALRHILEELNAAIREAALEDRAAALISVFDREAKFKELLEEFEQTPVRTHGH